MILRTIVGIIGLLQLLAPRRVTKFWVARSFQNSDDIELRSGVAVLVRLAGLCLVGWVLWQSREELAAATGAGPLSETETGIGADEEGDTSWDPATTGGAAGETATADEAASDPDTEPAATDNAAAEESGTADDATAVAAEDAPTLTPGTRRFQLASVLYHADESLRVADFVDLSDGTSWEVGRSPASTTLYRMYNDGAVDRQEGEGGSYEYWLTDAGRQVLESADADIEPNPFDAGNGD